MSAESKRTQIITNIIATEIELPQDPKILVVGCGTGREAITLAAVLKAEVIGIDTMDNFVESGCNTTLIVGNATSPTFEDNTFYFVFSYHALEHIPDYDKALSEMRRVLKSGGSFCIGTPNRNRLVGYLGGDTSIVNKLKWSAADWAARIKGKFRNEYGAHAGYSAVELENILLRPFSSAKNVSSNYYKKYTTVIWFFYGLLASCMRTNLFFHLCISWGTGEVPRILSNNAHI
jgi:ubiquinone/menaquinone biosynthesis C-methylase UbiE